MAAVLDVGPMLAGDLDEDHREQHGDQQQDRDDETHHADAHVYRRCSRIADSLVDVAERVVYAVVKER